ncbi:MAG: flavocytochrome c, partial [Mesosutterella sp.]|nr:flavocytochrome c [Mesosutterella sp.]
GLAAAVSAAQKGAKTVILEKMEVSGGNTRITGGAFNAVDPVEQKKKGIEDSVEKHAEQTLKAGAFRANPALVRQFTKSAPETLQWLKNCGVEFAPGVYQVYGGLYPRAHNTIKPFGLGYIDALTAQCKKLGVPIMLRMKVTSLLREHPISGKVTGVEVVNRHGKIFRYKAERGVIIASGGFSANPAIRALHDPRLYNLPTTNHKGATGDLIAPAQDIGAEVVGMDFIQLLPGAASNGRFIGMVSPVESVIFVNKNGDRFVAEDQRRDVISDAILSAPNKVVFGIRDQDGFNAMKPGAKKAFNGAFNTGDAFKADSLDDLALKIQIPAENLKRAVAQYNEAVDTKKDPLGRKPTVLVQKIEKAPFYAGRLTMAVHHTMGGIEINTKAQVIDRRGKPIPHLYAAGEVTGGIHGTNRVGGNAVAEIFTMGRIAGTNAAAEK